MDLVQPKFKGSFFRMPNIETFIVSPGTPEVLTIARWRAEEFSILQASAEREKQSLEVFTSDQRDQVALVAKQNGEPIGTCLLVKSEIDPLHAVTPWLAGLFVAPEHRRHGAGEILTRAIEEQAKLRGYEKLYLYTLNASGFYIRLGWHVVDQMVWKGRETAFMARDL